MGYRSKLYYLPTVFAILCIQALCSVALQFLLPEVGIFPCSINVGFAMWLALVNLMLTDMM